MGDTHKNSKKKTISGGPQMFNLVDKDFKVAIINILKELKETMFKDCFMVIKSSQIKIIKKRLKYIQF